MKRFSALALAIVMLCLWTTVSSAQELTGELMYLSEVRNMSIVAEYTDDGTGTIPELKFVSPAGEIFEYGKTEEERLSAVFFPEDGLIYYLLPNAQPGQWNVLYDSAFSGRLQITTTPYTREFLVQELTVDSVDDNFAQVSFQTSFDEDAFYTYTVSAVITDDSGFVTGRKTLCTGTAYANEQKQITVPIWSLASYGAYRLELKASLDDNGFVVADTALSEPFSYESTTMPDAIGDYAITFDRTTGQLHLDWSNVAPAFAESYIVGIYTDISGTETAAENSFTAEEKMATFLLEKEVTTITVELTYTAGGRTSKTNRTTFATTAVELEMDSIENTASAQTQVRYRVAGTEAIQLMLQTNGGEPDYYSISGTGTFAIPLAENRNELEFSYNLTDKITISYGFSIYSDRKAPNLTFFENVDGITVDGSAFRLTGMTESGATLLINGQETPFNADGTFSVSLSLTTAGANTFEIVARDPVGNMTRRTVVIFRSASPVDTVQNAEAGSSYLPFLLAALLAVALAALTLFLTRSGGETVNAVFVLKRSALGAWILAAAGAVCSIVFLIIRAVLGSNLDGKAFFEALQESIDAAYAILTDFSRYGTYLTVSAIVTAVLTLIAIVLTVLLFLFKNRKNSPKKPEKAKKKQKPEPKAPASPDASAGNAKIFCTNCGCPRVKGAEFCQQCGQKFE